MQSQQNQPFNRQSTEQGRNNVRQFPAPEPASSNPFDQVNKFDLAQWNQIVADISKPEVAKAVILVMDQRDSLKSLFPSIYVRAHQTCLQVEQKTERRARRMAAARKVSVAVMLWGKGAAASVRIGLSSLVSSAQRRLF